jgi:hypothetical protein
VLVCGGDFDPVALTEQCEFCNIPALPLFSRWLNLKDKALQEEAIQDPTADLVVLAKKLYRMNGIANYFGVPDADAHLHHLGITTRKKSRRSFSISSRLEGTASSRRCPAIATTGPGACGSKTSGMTVMMWTQL